MNLNKYSDWFESKSTEEALESCRNEGLEYIGMGSTRVVFRIPGDKRVVKFSKGNIYQNKTEVEVWNSAPNKLRDSLLPVERYAGDYAWIIMPEAEKVEPSPRELKRIKKRISKTGWRCKDANPSNIGRYQDRFVLIDYGAGCGPSGLGKKY